MQADIERKRAEGAYANAQAEYANGLVGQQFYRATSALPGIWPARSYSVFNTAESGGSMVIRTSEPDPNALANAEEDLNIMGRILEKAVAQKADDDQPQAMGIRLVTLAGHPSLRNLQIEGFGAVFFLNVNFPLVGPARNTGNNDEKPASSSTWDEAKRELYGPAPGAGGLDESSSKEAYDPKRVEKLQDTLLQALKNATNIRSLRSDESVMLVVNGGNGGGWSELTSSRFQNKLTRTAPASIGGGGRSGGVGTGSQSGYKVVTHDRLVHVTADGSVLTIRAKKSDIDAFANGKLDLNEFRNKVKMLAYPTLSGGNPDMQVIMSPATKY